MAILQNNGSFTVPQLCFLKTKLRVCAFCFGKAEQLLHKLDAYGGTGPDAMFPFLFRKAD